MIDVGAGSGEEMVGSGPLSSLDAFHGIVRAMKPRVTLNLSTALLIGWILVGPARAEAVSQDRIDTAIEKGLEFLLTLQRPDGSWRGPFVSDFPQGTTALATYTLLRCGLRPEHPAVRRAVAYMESTPVERTYAAAVTLLAYQALRDPTREPKVKELTRFLLKHLGDSRWPYPRASNDFFDLSNTQYGLLGMRAAAAMGQRVPTDVWKRVALGLIDTQDEGGGWKYREGHSDINAGMTAAGVYGLLVCADELRKSRRLPSLVRQAERHIELGLGWLTKHWSVDKNHAIAEGDANAIRWYYFYLYGLERIGGLSGRDILDGHDWYAEGAEVLVRKQRKNGSFGTAYGDEDTNTCCALLFLRRGSSTTEKARTVARDRSEAETFVVATTGKNPFAAWVRDRGAAVKKRLESGERAVAVEWFVAGRPVGRIEAKAGSDGGREDFLVESELTRNGTVDVVAHMHFQGTDGNAAGMLESERVWLRVDDIETHADRVALFDHENGVPQSAEATASSSLNGSPPALAVDGIGATDWLAGEDDEAPWLRLRFARPVRARTVRLSPARSYSGHERELSRPQSIVLVLNGSRKLPFTLPDRPLTKHTLDLGGAVNLRSLGIRIESRYEGWRHPKRIGLAEVELLRDAGPTSVATGARENVGAQPEADHLRFDFESGTPDGFTILEGDAGRTVGSRRRGFHGDGRYPCRGRYYLTTLEARDGTERASQIAVLRSPAFVLTKPDMRFLISGGKKESAYVALVDAETGKELARAHGPAKKEASDDVAWSLPDAVGKPLYLEIVDRGTEAEAYVVFDDFHATGSIRR